MPPTSSTFHRWFAILALIAVWPVVAHAQDRIEQIRQDANAPDAPAPPSKPRNSSNNTCSSDDFFVQAIFYVVASPFLLPHRLLDDDLTRDGFFLPYPYSNQFPGYVWLGQWPAAPSGLIPQIDAPPVRWWSMRFLVEEGNNFDGLNRVGFRASFDVCTRFGLQSNWNYLSENLNNGLYDQTVLGDTNLIYRFAQDEFLQFYSGLGVRVLADPRTTKWGGNVVYGLDLFPKKPWVFSSVFDAGNVGNAAVLHTRATVGVTMTHFELFGGYDYMRIGSVNVQGPVVGLRLWF